MISLTGKKTYINAILIGVASTIHYLGFIDVQAYALILGLLGATTVASLRHSVPPKLHFDELEKDNEAE